MKNLLNKWIFFSLNILLSIIIFLSSAPDYTLKYFIDSLFYVSLTYVILMLFLFVIKGRFFDGITWSFRRFRQVMSKNRDYLAEMEGSPPPSTRINITFYRFIAFQTAALIVAIILLLSLYYFL